VIGKIIGRREKKERGDWIEMMCEVKEKRKNWGGE
jgi:hypothetical protein